MKTKFKISIGLITVLFLMGSVNQSCKKYEEGPAFSLLTRKARVANTWKVENYKINGDDYTSLVSSYTETFTKGGAYNYSWGILDGSGTWTFQNNDKEIKLNGSNSQASRTLFILKLEDKAFWYYYMESNDRKEFHMISN
jgi:hypothetical protein